MRPTRRRWLALAAAALGGLASGCAGDGHFRLLGYTSEPNYDCSFKTVYVPIIHTKVFQAGPFRDLEFKLTKAVIREIEARTPYKVVDTAETADTELKVTIVNLVKAPLLVHQENQVRTGELYLTVELVWRDLRTGKVLSNRDYGRGVDPATIPRFDNTVPGPVVGADGADAARIAVSGLFRPEVGESVTTGIQAVVNAMAVKISQVMEKPW